MKKGRLGTPRPIRAKSTVAIERQDVVNALWALGDVEAFLQYAADRDGPWLNTLPNPNNSIRWVRLVCYGKPSEPIKVESN